MNVIPELKSISEIKQTGIYRIDGGIYHFHLNTDSVKVDLYKDNYHTEITCNEHGDWSNGKVIDNKIPSAWDTANKTPSKMLLLANHQLLQTSAMLGVLLADIDKFASSEVKDYICRDIRDLTHLATEIEEVVDLDNIDEDDVVVPHLAETRQVIDRANRLLYEQKMEATGSKKLSSTNKHSLQYMLSVANPSAYYTFESLNVRDSKIY